MCSSRWPRAAIRGLSNSIDRCRLGSELESVAVGDRVFFYGTLMSPFNRPGRQRVTAKLTYLGRGTIEAALFDLGIYPAAIPEDRGVVWGEVYETADLTSVLTVLDEIEGYRPSEPSRSLYLRQLTEVTLEGGAIVAAWAYFYNAPLGGAHRIPSGDYLEHLGQAN